VEIKMRDDRSSAKPDLKDTFQDKASILLASATLAISGGCAEKDKSATTDPFESMSTPGISEAFPVRTGADPEWFLVQVELYNQSLEEYVALAPELDKLRRDLEAKYGPDLEGLSRTDRDTLEHLRQDTEGARLRLSDLAENYQHYAEAFGPEQLIHFRLPLALPIEEEPSANSRVELSTVDQSIFSEERLTIYRDNYLNR